MTPCWFVGFPFSPFVLLPPEPAGEKNREACDIPPFLIFSFSFPHAVH